MPRQANNRVKPQPGEALAREAVPDCAIDLVSDEDGFGVKVGPKRTVGGGEGKQNSASDLFRYLNLWNVSGELRWLTSDELPHLGAPDIPIMSSCVNNRVDTVIAMTQNEVVECLSLDGYETWLSRDYHFRSRRCLSGYNGGTLSTSRGQIAGFINNDTL